MLNAGFKFKFNLNTFWIGLRIYYLRKWPQSIIFFWLRVALSQASYCLPVQQQAYAHPSHPFLHHKSITGRVSDVQSLRLTMKHSVLQAGYQYYTPGTMITEDQHSSAEQDLNLGPKAKLILEFRVITALDPSATAAWYIPCLFSIQNITGTCYYNAQLNNTGGILVGFWLVQGLLIITQSKYRLNLGRYGVRYRLSTTDR